MPLFDTILYYTILYYTILSRCPNGLCQTLVLQQLRPHALVVGLVGSLRPSLLAIARQA